MFRGRGITPPGNLDDSVNVADATKLLEVLFQSGAMECEDAFDVNDNGSVEFIDTFVLLNDLFGDAEIPEPTGTCGEDTTDETVLNLGGVAARGERGLLALPTDLLMRLRYNPFFAYLERRLIEEVEPARP